MKLVCDYFELPVVRWYKALNPNELNSILIWILRFAYPLTAIILWRRWVPGAAFLGYLIAATYWVWTYDPHVLWRALLASALTSPLELLATYEIARNFLVDDWREHRERVMRAVWIMGLAGTVMALMLQGPGDTWHLYMTFRAALHIGCFMMLLTVSAYTGIAQMKAHWLTWVHCIIWTGYMLPVAVSIPIQMRLITGDAAGARLWESVTCAIYLISLGCLALWCYFAFNVGTIKSHGLSGGAGGGLSRSASRVG